MPLVYFIKEQTLELRINYAKVAPGVVNAMRDVSNYLRKCGLEQSLLLLIDLRASAFIYGYVVSGQIASQVEGQPERIYHAGEAGMRCREHII
jgi:hypothetical protein